MALWDDWGNPLDDEAEEIDDRNFAVAMVTCPYYWADRIPGAMCRNGCWEEPMCQTSGPFDPGPLWPAERCLARAVDRHVHEPPPA